MKTFLNVYIINDMFSIFNSQCANFVRFCIPFRCDTVKRRRGAEPSAFPVRFPFLLAAHLVENIGDGLLRCLRRERDDDDGRAGGEECGQQLIDGPRAAHRRNEVLPHKDDYAAGEHTRERALLVRALPEEREEHHGAERRAKARPRERHHAEHRAVGIPREHDADQRDADDRGARGEHRRAMAHLHAEGVLHEVLRHAGRRGQELRVRRRHRGG